MRLLTRYLTREILAYAAGVFVLILGVFLVRRSALLLAELTEAALPIGVVLELLALRTMMAFPSLLPSVVYIAVLLALTRLNENRELEALQASGVSRARIYGSVVPVAVAGALVIGALALWGRPWAAKLYLETRAEATIAAGTDQMRPGRFYELDWGGSHVFFAERRAADDPRFLEGVFLHQVEDGRRWVHYAERALEQRDDEGHRRLLGLFAGRRYGFPLAVDDQEIIEYGELVMAFPLPEAEITLAEEEMGVGALLADGSPDSAAELQWRLAMPLSTLVLVLLALPLCPERAGAGYGARLFTALLVYVGYRQVLGTGKRWIADGALAPLPGLLVVHGLFLLLALALLWQQRARLHGGGLRLPAGLQQRLDALLPARGRG